MMMMMHGFRNGADNANATLLLLLDVLLVLLLDHLMDKLLIWRKLIVTVGEIVAEFGRWRR